MYHAVKWRKKEKLDPYPCIFHNFSNLKSPIVQCCFTNSDKQYFGYIDSSKVVLLDMKE